MSDTIFINTNFVTPDELDAKADELKALAAKARAADNGDGRFVRIWCDNGSKSGFPYTQLYVDKWTKQNRWTWIKGRKVEREQAAERKADKEANQSASSSDDGGQLQLPIE